MRKLYAATIHKPRSYTSVPLSWENTDPKDCHSEERTEPKTVQIWLHATTVAISTHTFNKLRHKIQFSWVEIGRSWFMYLRMSYTAQRIFNVLLLFHCYTWMRCGIVVRSKKPDDCETSGYYCWHIKCIVPSQRLDQITGYRPCSHSSYRTSDQCTHLFLEIWNYRISWSESILYSNEFSFFRWWRPFGNQFV